jgi:NADPH-dependent curcumin reductase CurA
MRGRMTDALSYAEPVQLGEIMVGENSMAMSGFSKDAFENRELFLKGKEEIVEAWVVRL